MVLAKLTVIGIEIAGTISIVYMAETKLNMIAKDHAVPVQTRVTMRVRVSLTARERGRGEKRERERARGVRARVRVRAIVTVGSTCSTNNTE